MYEEQIKNGLSYLKTGVDDEKYAQGFWDLAGSIADDCSVTLDFDMAQEAIYNALVATAEAAMKAE